MKIHRIDINQYNQFKHLSIDLTYPRGHEKAGLPLEKVCFIGQSGTGKTSLLRLIKYFVTDSPAIGTGIFLPRIKKGQVAMNFSFDDVIFRKESYFPESKFVLSNSNDGISTQWADDMWLKIALNFEKYKPTLINFPTERIVANNEKVYSQPKDERDNYLLQLQPDHFVDFAFEDSSKAWDFVLSSVRKHRVEELYWRKKISDVALNKNSNQADIQQINGEYQAWIEQNPNPIETLSDSIDVILKELGVRIKTDIDKDTIQYQNDILLQTLDGVTLERDFWSTGTKQIVDTALPLFQIKPNNAIVLIDEPERSLYPNLQQKVVDFYTSLGVNCQFIFATHSPIIASSFDPWEVFELQFDSTNTSVVARQNYTGERHVDTFTVFPKYLKWDDILLQVFNLSNEGNDVYRTPELMNAVSLRRKLERLKAEGKANDESFKVEYQKYVRLQQKLGWDEKD